MNFRELAQRGFELLKESNENEVNAIAEPHNEDLSGIAAGIAMNAKHFGVESPGSANVIKYLVSLAFALGYKQAQADATPIDDVWKE